MTPQPQLLYILIVGVSLTLLGLDLLLPLGVANAVLYAGVVFLAALSPSSRLPVVTAAGCSALTIVGAWLSPSIPGVPLWVALSNRAFSLIAIWVPVLFLAQRRQTETQLRQLNESLEARVHTRTAEIAAKELALRRTQEELRALTSRLLTVQDEERRRIAHDLHDDVNQRLAMLALGLRTLEQPEQALPEPTRATLNQHQQDIALLSEDVRRMAYRFHPSILDDLGLDAALKRLLDDFTHRTTIKTVLVMAPLATAPSKNIATAVYRIVQECLSNITRHAKATRVEVELFAGAAELDLTVRDNGVGFETTTKSPARQGLGLFNLRERALAFHGTSRVQSQPGQGTEIHVQLPLCESPAP
ncbi:MAG: sensor histidine kinase [Nitrospira sp.]